MVQLPAGEDYQPTQLYTGPEFTRPHPHAVGTSCDNLVAMAGPLEQPQVRARLGRVPPPLAHSPPVVAVACGYGQLAWPPRVLTGPPWGPEAEPIASLGRVLCRLRPRRRLPRRIRRWRLEPLECLQPPAGTKCPLALAYHADVPDSPRCCACRWRRRGCCSRRRAASSPRAATLWRRRSRLPRYAAPAVPPCLGHAALGAPLLLPLRTAGTAR